MLDAKRHIVIKVPPDSAKDMISLPESEPWRKSISDGLAVRTLFLSDLHLGTKGCQAGLLLDFLKHCDVDTIYLVGDVIDGWRLKSGWYWPEAHNNVVRKLLKTRP